MWERLKNLLLYDGLKSKEDYAGVLVARKEQNRKNLAFYTALFCLAFAGLGIVSCFVEDLSNNRAAYFTVSVCSLFLCIVMLTLAKKQMWVNTLVTYLFLTMLFAFGIVIGTVNEPSEPAIAICAICLLVPVCIYDIQLRFIIFRILMIIVFLALAFVYKDRSVVWTDIVDMTFYGMIGIIVGILNQQITTRAYYTQDKLKESLDALNKLNESINNEMQVQTQFTNSMNHELRSPLNGIIGNMEVLLMDDSIGTEGKNCVSNAYNSSKIMLKTVNDLLDFAKLREGKFEIVPNDFDLHKVISDISGSFDKQIEQKGLEYRLEVNDETICGLYADDLRIEQVINNLLSNAVKYTDKGYVKCSFAVADIKDDDAMLSISVEDSGQGMETSSIDEIAEPFARFNLQKNKNIQGTGLGMNIVRNLVNEMKGEITCKSVLGEGTVFKVSIPVKITNRGNVYSGHSDKAASPKIQTDDFTGISILCIDDTKMNLDVFKGLLRKTGAEITTCESGREGLSLACANKYDIIFADHMMPGMDGIETCHEIGKTELNGDTPCVMLSGNTGDDYQKMYKDAGIKYFLGKPILRAELIKLIQGITEAEK